MTDHATGQTTTFTYDGHGALVKKVAGGQTTIYIGAHYEKNITTGVATGYYYAGGRRVAMRQGGVVYYLLTDHLGSTALTVSSGGVKVAELRYKAWGETRYTWGTTPTGFRYTGQRQEESLGLYQMGARFYDPALARWLSADTLVPEPGNPQALNRYAYVLGNPLLFIDPSGHRQVCNRTGTICADDEESPPPPPLPPPPPPPPPIGYDPHESVQQAWELVGEWFFEQGPAVRYFGPESSLTQDIMYDPGMTQFREAWAAAGYPSPWEWKHQADVREGGLLPLRIAKGGFVYIRENLQLVLAKAGLGSTTSEGPIDAVGGIIGSLDQIHVESAGGGLIKIEVINTMDWRSGSRIPGTNWSLIRRSLPRSAWGPGGATVQHFYWWEVMPAR